MTDPWEGLRAATRARVGLGRAGDALPTKEVLRFSADHALARDAVHEVLDTDLLQGHLTAAGLPEAPVVRSQAKDRSSYLQRPDLGRRLATAAPESRDLDLVVVLADGLSARATHAHAVPLLKELLPQLQGWTTQVVIAQQARVALGDEIAQGSRCALVLLGERPGLSAPDSLGAYLTWMPRPGRRDAERNCVSNIRPPHGLGIASAAGTLARLLVSARTLQLSGVALKDDGVRLPASS